MLPLHAAAAVILMTMVFPLVEVDLVPKVQAQFEVLEDRVPEE